MLGTFVLNLDSATAMNQVKCGLRSVFHAICARKQDTLALVGLAIFKHHNRTLICFGAILDN